MYYVCIENEAISSVMPYEPNVPDTFTVVAITDDEYRGAFKEKTHYFDMVTMSVLAFAQSHLDTEEAKKTQERSNAENRFILESTDWQVLRHFRQKALGQTTTLSDEEYLALEQTRADAAAAIVQIQ